MSLKSFVYCSESNHAKWQRIFVRSPAARIAWFVCFLVASSLLINLALGALSVDLAAQGVLTGMGVIERVIPPALAYLALKVLLERSEHLIEKSRNEKARYALVALLTGSALALGVFIVVAMCQGIRVEGVRDVVPWGETILLYGVASVVGEELVARGVFYRLLQDGLGTTITLATSVLVFALVHRNNPDATAWSTAAFSIEHGLLFPAIYRASKNSLIITMSAHAGWGVVQSALFGVHGLIIYKPIAAAWLSGGSFGVEASVVASVACSAISIRLLRRASRDSV